MRVREQTDPKIFATRHRFLLVLVLAMVPLLAVIGLARGAPVSEIGVASLLLVVMALIGMTAKSRGLAAGAIALGLVTVAGILVRYLEGTPESLFAFFLALVAISFYRDTRLLLVGLVYVAGYQLFAIATLYRESPIYRSGVADLALPVTAIVLDVMLVILLIAGWRLAGKAGSGNRETEEGFRLGFDRARIGMAMLTPAGEFMYANEALIDMLGPLDQANIKSMVHADDLGQLGQAWEDMGNAITQSASAWMRFRTSDGRAIWGDMSLSFVRAHRRQPATILLQLEDATRTHQEERRLERLLDGRDQFVAAIADDIRAPIGSILDLTAETDGDHLDLHRTMRQIGTHAREISAIVADLIVSARADTTPVTVLARSLDAGLLCEEALMQIPEPDDISLDVGATALWADPGLTKRIVSSLLGNALRYGGATVSLKTTSSGPDTIISVIDDGPAIPARDRERIFNGDLRSGQPVTSPAVVGLSLTVARHLARQMDGEITYRRTGDGHNVFELRLPSEQYAPVEPELVPA